MSFLTNKIGIRFILRIALTAIFLVMMAFVGINYLYMTKMNRKVAELSHTAQHLQEKAGDW